MGTTTDDSVFIAALDVIATCTEMYACATEPTSRADAVSKSLTVVEVMTPGDGNGDFTISSVIGGAGGMEVEVAAKTGVVIDGDGDFDHVAYCTATTLLHVKTGTPQTLTSGGTVNFPITTIVFEDPIAV